MPLTQEQQDAALAKKIFGFVGAGIFGVLLLVAGCGSYTIVGSGERGVVTYFGSVQDQVLGEGLHFKMPIRTTIHKISIRVQKTESIAEAASKDIQKVHATVALNWNVDAATVNKMYQNIGDTNDVKERIIDPAVAEVLKAATAKRTAEEILTKRLELKAEIDAMLIERLSKYNVLVKDISLVNLDFTQEFNRAVESKQIAEQRAQEAGYEAQQAEQAAKSAVNKAKGEAAAVEIMAKGQAKAQELLRSTITPQLLQKQAIEKWNGEFPQMMGGNGALPFINFVPKAKKGASNEE